MTIKHIDGGNDFYVGASEWLTEYVITGKHKNFKVTGYGSAVELYTIDKETGESKFSQVIDVEKVRQHFSNPKLYYNKPLAFEHYDKNLVPNRIKNTNHRNLFINLWSKIPSIKKTAHKIRTSTTSKLLGNLLLGVVITVLGGLILLVVWAIFGDWIVSQFK